MKPTNEFKKQVIEKNIEAIMTVMGLDMKDDSLIGTPKRVAKMFIEEVFSGLDEANMPKIATFENKYDYDQMLIESNIEINSFCEHHLLPILGVGCIAYIPNKKVIGLSKLNRIAKYYGKRPQVQERLTKQIITKLQEVLETEDVAVMIDAQHLCVKIRGVEDSCSDTRTFALGGKFKNCERTRAEFMNQLPKVKG